MDLSRYWRVTLPGQGNGRNIEVQWTGVRFKGGWTLRLFVDGVLKAERKVPRFADNFEVREGPVTVNFWGKPLRHRCTISAGGKVLIDRTQPWNLLAFAIILSPIALGLILALLNNLHAVG
jgi:hypothetical protein